MKKFEIKRIREFKELFVKYLNNLLEHQQTVSTIDNTFCK